MSASNVSHVVIGADGVHREVDPAAFQLAIDKGLARYNNGIIPTTDQERVKCMKAQQKEVDQWLATQSEESQNGE